MERCLFYKGTCHVILLAKLRDMYLYKTDNFFHINHYLKSVSKVALLHRFDCTSSHIHTTFTPVHPSLSPTPSPSPTPPPPWCLHPVHCALSHIRPGHSWAILSVWSWISKATYLAMLPYFVGSWTALYPVQHDQKVPPGILGRFEYNTTAWFAIVNITWLWRCNLWMAYSYRKSMDWVYREFIEILSCKHVWEIKLGTGSSMFSVWHILR